MKIVFKVCPTCYGLVLYNEDNGEEFCTGSCSEERSERE